MWKLFLIHILNSFIKIGHLQVSFPDKSTSSFGDPESEPVRIQFKDNSTVRAFCLYPELTLGEAYMNERLTVNDDNIQGLLNLAIQNMVVSGRMAPHAIIHRLRKAFRLFLYHNPIGKAQSNVKHHYDLSDELYAMFLDADRQYSCAYFEDPDITLEEAQIRKKAHIAKKLLLKPELSVLDIGSGWGGMGITLAKEHHCRVTGVTLSTNQHQVSNERAKKERVSNQAKFFLTDYRNIEASFDRIVSIGMFEHVGAPHYRQFFRHIRRLLKNDGVALLHTIGRSQPPGVTNPWITKYIFPGGYIPSMSEVMAAIEKEGLIVCDIEVLRLHYAETLKHWQKRFLDHKTKIQERYDDRFCRMWKFYLTASEASFRYGGQVVFQFQIAKNVGSVPLTRNYLYKDSKTLQLN